MRIAAIVLAGGQSRRMGTDKALLRLPTGGPTLVERVVAAAWAAGADEVLIVAGDEARMPGMNARRVPDAQMGAGPLAGLATGFAAAQCDAALALACDLPYLSVPLLRWMITQLYAGAHTEWDALVPFLPDNGQAGKDGKAGWQPLHALYTHACLTSIRAALLAGERRMTAFFPPVRVRALTAAAMSRYDPALRSTRSVNTPEAWDEAARWLVAQEGDILPHRTSG